MAYDYFQDKQDKIQSFLARYGTGVELLLAAVGLFWWVYASGTGLPTVIQEAISMVLSGALVLCFAFERGKVSAFLNGQTWLRRFGAISMEFYLIHYLVIHIGDEFFRTLFPSYPSFVNFTPVLYLAVSVLLAICLHRLSGKLFRAGQRDNGS